MVKSNKSKDIISITIVSLSLFMLSFYSSTSCYALSWNEAKISLAKNNYNLRVSYENIQIARNDFSISKSQLNPVISLRGGAERFLQEDASLGFRSFLGPRLTWALYQGGKIRNAVKQSKINILSKKNSFSFDQVKQESELRQAFANAIYAKKNVELSKKSLQRSLNNYRYVRLRYKGGQEYGWVFKSAEKTILENEANLIKSEQEAKIALFSLQQIIGYNEIQSIDKIVSDGFDVPKSIDSINVNQFINNHPALLNTKNNAELSVLNVKSAKADKSPFFQFRTDFIIADTDDSQVFPFWYAGVNLYMPIFESGRYRKAARTAIVKSKQTMALLQRQKRIQKQNIELQVMNYKWSLKNKDVVEVNLEAIKNKYKLFQKQYREGLIPYVQWDNAQEELRLAERQWLKGLQLIQAEYAKLLLSLGVTEYEFKTI